MNTLSLALRRRDALTLLITGLLLALLLLSGLAPSDLGVAGPTTVVGGATALQERCDLDTPCATGIAAPTHAWCELTTACATDTGTALATADEPPGVDTLIANVLCDLNSPCAPDPIAAWNRLCDLNTPCLPGEAANGSAPGQQGVVQLDPAADTSGLAQWDTFDFERWVQARLYAIEVRDSGAGTTDGDGGPCRAPGRSCDR